MAASIRDSTAGSNTAALPAGTVSGDIVVVFALNGNNGTIPSFPTDWTVIDNIVVPGKVAARSISRVYDGVWTMPTFTNTTRVHAITITGQDATNSLGGHSVSSGATNAVNWPALTLTDSSGGSVVLRSGCHVRPEAAFSTPTGHTLLEDGTNTTPGHVTFNKNDTTNGATASSTISRADEWVSLQVEIIPASGTAHEQNPTDTENLTDTVAVDRGLVRTDNENLTDSVTLASDIARSFTDSENLTDEVTVATGHSRSFTDNENLTDSVTTALGHNREFLDSIGVTDSIAIIIDHGRVFTDSLGLTDSVTLDLFTGPQNFTVEVTDNLGLTDDAGKFFHHTKTETLELSDLFSKEQPQFPIDSMAITDEILIQRGFGVSQQDTLGLSDVLVFDYGPGAVDSVNLSDEVIISLVYNRLFEDSFSLTDVAFVGIPLVPDLVDNLNLTDEVILDFVEGSPVEIQNIVNLFNNSSVAASSTTASQPTRVAHTRAVRVVIPASHADITVKLQGSIDGNQWFDLAAYTAGATGYQALYELPGLYIRLFATNTNLAAQTVTAGVILEVLR